MNKYNDPRNIVEEPTSTPNIYLSSGQQLALQPYSPVGTQARVTPQQPLTTPFGPIRNRAPVCCNCCNCSHDSCAQFWAIFNLVQVYICYFLIAMRHLLWEGSNSLAQNPKLVKEDECREMNHVVGTPPTNVTFSVETLLLMLYAIGSVFFAAAVFHKTLGSQQRSKFLLIYIVLLASLPLAYLIPLVIRYALCVRAGTRNLILVVGWFIFVVITTICAANVAWVLRKWVMANGKNMAVPSMSQPQIVGSTITTGTSDGPDGDNQGTT